MRGQNHSNAHGLHVPTIRLLPDPLVDQIAAGEVVERPASVVKELVENALDAGATRIRIAVRDGGAACISVADDGCGMDPAQARLALQRHATSKLAEQSDLQRIRSFGFRGEALPAIASVSRMRLFSRARGADAGHEIRVEAGEVLGEQSAGGPEGTRIEVADLFSNVPARRKFLKKAGTEWGHIADWLGRLALALPGVHFEVQRDDRAAVVWPATSDPLARIAAVLSMDEAEGLVPIEWEEQAGHVQAFVSPPDRTRANGNGLYLYVNGRPVRDKLLRHAVLEAYRDLLPRGRYPTAIVLLTVAPERVDVNVHPAKWEVRFEEQSGVHQLVRHAIAEAMRERSWLGGQGARPAMPAPAPAPRWRPARPSAAAEPSPPAGDWQLAAAAEPATRVAEGPGAGPRAHAPPEALPLIPEPASRIEEGRVEFGKLVLIGQMKASYLILEGRDGMILVDQHAAHERVLYERLRAAWLEQGVARQQLLVPETVELDPIALAALMEAGETVEALGFEVEPFGEGAVVLRAVPALLSECDPVVLLRGLAEELAEAGVVPERAPDRTRLLAAADRAIATLACHSARRFGDHLPPDEQRAILEGLDTIPWAPTCPHGRPVAISLSVTDIERRFGRR